MSNETATTEPAESAPAADASDTTEQSSDSSASNDFARHADEDQVGLIAEFVDFLVHNKKWWLAPIIIVLGLVALLVFLSGTAAAPFIYPIF